jgi:hypothetical protein
MGQNWGQLVCPTRKSNRTGLLRRGGEPARNRTENLQIKSLLLCQLSYGPEEVRSAECEVAITCPRRAVS